MQALIAAACLMSSTALVEARNRKRMLAEEEEDSSDSTWIIVGCVCGGALLLCIGYCVYEAYREAKQIEQDEKDEEKRQAREFEEFKRVLAEYARKRDMALEESVSDFKVQSSSGKGQSIEMTQIANTSQMDMLEQSDYTSGTKMTHMSYRNRRQAHVDQPRNMKKHIMSDFDDLENLEDMTPDQLQHEIQKDYSNYGLQKQSDKILKADQQKTKQAVAIDPNRKPYTYPYTAEELWECRDPILVAERGDWDPYEGMSPRTRAQAKIVREAQIKQLIQQMKAECSSDSDEKKKKKKKNKSSRPKLRGKKAKLYAMGD